MCPEKYNPQGKGMSHMLIRRLSVNSRAIAAVFTSLAVLAAGVTAAMPQPAQGHITSPKHCIELNAMVKLTAAAEGKKVDYPPFISCPHVGGFWDTEIYLVKYKKRGDTHLARVLVTHFDCYYPPDNRCHRAHVRKDRVIRRS